MRRARVQHVFTGGRLGLVQQQQDGGELLLMPWRCARGKVLVPSGLLLVVFPSAGFCPDVNISPAFSSN